MRFISHGFDFPKDQAISIGWDIRALIDRLAELKQDDPCPMYNADNPHTFLHLDLYRRETLATVGLCLLVLTIFERCADQWGVMEMRVRFGEGKDTLKPQGQFEIGLRWPLGRSEVRRRSSEKTRVLEQ